VRREDQQEVEGASPYSEGAAIRTDPESCAGHCREAVREALTGGRIGEVLSESNVAELYDPIGSS
jgi:hypothetical protein